MRLAVYAEWTKLRTVPGPAWLLVATIVLTTGLSAVAGAAVTCGVGCTQDPGKISLTGIQLGQALVAALAVLMVTGEYSTGMIRTTLAAIPRRCSVLTAKAIVVTGVVLAVGTVAVVGSLVAARLSLRGNGFTAAHGRPLLSLADATMLRAAAGSVVYLALIALLSLGVAIAVRDSAAAIGVVLGLLYLFPILAGVVSDPHWQRRLQRYAPSSAGQAIESTVGVHALPISPWAGLGVLALWAAAALLGGALLLRLRDA